MTYFRVCNYTSS